jgi:hypothetical protein
MSLADSLLPLLLGVGGTGAIAGILNVVVTNRNGKNANTESLIARLSNDAKTQGDRADKAEMELSTYRRQAQAELSHTQLRLEKARDRAVTFRRQLVALGVEGLPELNDLYE